MNSKMNITGKILVEYLLITERVNWESPRLLELRFYIFPAVKVQSLILCMDLSSMSPDKSKDFNALEKGYQLDRNYCTVERLNDF